MLNPQESVLIIVDVQGKLAKMMRNAQALENNISTLIEAATLFNIPILWLEQLPDKLGATSDKLREQLAVAHQPIAKSHFSAWHAPEFRAALTATARNNVLLAGIETHICVYQTCRDLLSNQYQVHVIADAVSSRTAENRSLGIEMMLQHGALLNNTESLLFELQQEAKGERFKALLKLIK
ncbi:hydrolase [Shewanella colwelliana]|uniref:hydrolase n=1 Tax=Shewanella colwelliana TaxID=23 RepID=UPI0022AF572D|nr:hydrolase [Shewanella colwelliana]MCZ4336018.1 hydrolase [Shewanella colwelliana]